MRALLSIFASALLCVVLAGCPGMEFYQPTLIRNADGTSSVKSVRIAKFWVDIVGLESFSINYRTGDVTLKFQEGLLYQEQYAVVDNSGKVVGFLTRHVVPGIYTAKVVEAYGSAGKKWIDSTGSLITGAILSAAGPVALGNGLAAIPIKP
jgi:hypothetical protein